MNGYSISNEKYNGYPVIYRKGSWNGARANTILKAGKIYVVTVYSKGTGQIALYGSTSFTAPAKTITSDWIRYGWVIYDVTSDTNELRVENVSDSGETYIACMQIEEGTTGTDYEPYIPSVKTLTADVADIKNDLGKLPTFISIPYSTSSNEITITVPDGGGARKLIYLFTNVGMISMYYVSERNEVALIVNDSSVSATLTNRNTLTVTRNNILYYSEALAVVI